MIVVERILGDADLETLVVEINAASWDEANDMGRYDVKSLRRYVQNEDTVFVTCREVVTSTATLLGLASGRLELKPYGSERWLYVDEVDVAADQRRKGAGSALMSKLFDIARDAGCTEVWLGTEVADDAANGLYSALKPSEIETFVGYTWALR